MATSFTFHAAGEADTERLGCALAQAAPRGVVALDGVLGAGKTRLVQAVAAALAVDRRDVVSPTFVLVHEYQGAQPIYHFDAYRVRDDDEFLALGAEEYFDPANLVFVEWASRVARCLPKDHLVISIEIVSNDERRFTILGHGPEASAAVERLRALL